VVEPIQITSKVIAVFDRLQISYFMGGSLASALYGLARSTLDADIVADIKPEHIGYLVEQLNDEFYIDPEMVLDAILNHSSFNLVHLETMFKVDVFTLKQRPFDLNQMQRRIKQFLGDSQTGIVYFSTAEDIILAKLEWFLAGGEISERQWQDILGVLALQAARLDYDYLHKWATELGVINLLQKAIQQAKA
jgi:hypothetical protein